MVSARNKPTGESEASITDASRKREKLSSCTSEKRSRAPRKLATR
jgi:hypothetical protein